MPGILMSENLVILTVSRRMESAHTNTAMTSTIQTSDVCHECGKAFVPDGLMTGYGWAMPNYGDKFDRDAAVKLCYECCGKRDALEMARTGKFTGYLVGRKVTNWPCSLEFKVTDMSKGHHNIAGSRYDVWFTVVNVETGRRENWHGVQYGENSDICRCRRLKGVN